MKVFKTERIIYFNSKLPKKPNKIIKTPQSFLSKKLCLFKVEKYDEYFENELEGSYKGRWTLKEHILFLQAIDRYGVNWKKIRKVVKTRTSKQIRSHSQKFFIKLKHCKDEDLGIDFTLDSIHNMKDIINHIKSVNNDFDVVNILLYMPGKDNRNTHSKKLDQIENELNINNIFNKDINVNNVCLNNSNNDAKERDNNSTLYKELIDKEKASFNNFSINNIFVYNLNFVNINSLDFMLSCCLNNTIIMNNIYNINNNTFINNVFHNSKNNINNDNNIQKDLSDDKILANHTLINPDRNDNTNNTKN